MRRCGTTNCAIPFTSLQRRPPQIGENAGLPTRIPSRQAAQCPSNAARNSGTDIQQFYSSCMTLRSCELSAGEADSSKRIYYGIDYPREPTPQMVARIV